ncbi:sugar ABC transporter substrate-binding protein [Sphaerochaeta halotolerans]|jgi:ribose transport system substrate-binding protein|uniref:Sugar ABC transporter substrate-binding protein n=1 Tax=Sphaerochaeta halotolerans TaxID=2293840 RepID=A0A372MDW8_9SPIR|nr:sugar ABC transporter substrate-binding protein [Sphaerochaeta halotolerans]MBG0767120.1 sugar ABC transporter substrate-binding protein [Spirochaetaceae bacterium]MXI87504.1 substrate-binding domain-containing protein [Sphaerochaeta halotolerans]RFU93995.1 sugar ABC transporter substrate-binding protein [Sphaerochaeta halotolerans]
MKKTMMILLALVLIASQTALFAQGQNETADSGKMKVAVVLKTLSSEYWQRVVNGAEEAAAKYDVELIKLGPPTEDAVEQQINMVQDALTANPAALVFSPSQPPTAVNVVNRAKNQGIPVILVDTPMADGFENYDTFIGTENYVAGQMGAKAMVDALGRAGKAVVIEGAPGNPTTTQRADGAEDVFKEAGFEIVARQPGYSDRERAYTVMQNILQGNADIDAVFCSNDEMALGALRALQQVGIDALVLGTDGNKSALESILEGGLFGTAAQKPEAMGYLGVEYAIKAANGETIEKRIDSGVDIITIENAQAALDALQ